MSTEIALIKIWLETINKIMKNIYKKLLDIQKLGLTFTKNAENPFFKSKYLDLDDLNKGLMPTLNEKGLLLLHRTRKRQSLQRL